jgi:trans-aconitate methyltransferase
MPHRAVAEEMLLGALPEPVARFVDLGTAMGAFWRWSRGRYPEAEGMGLDSSAPMLGRAKERFGNIRDLPFASTTSGCHYRSIRWWMRSSPA